MENEYKGRTAKFERNGHVYMRLLTKGILTRIFTAIRSPIPRVGKPKSMLEQTEIFLSLSRMRSTTVARPKQGKIFLHTEALIIGTIL